MIINLLSKFSVKIILLETDQNNSKKIPKSSKMLMIFRSLYQSSTFAVKTFKATNVVHMNMVFEIDKIPEN